MAAFEATLKEFREIKERVVFIGNIPNPTAENDLIKLIIKYGDIRNLYLQSSKEARSNVKIAYVHFRGSGSARRCAEELHLREFHKSILIAKTMCTPICEIRLKYDTTLAVSNFKQETDLVDIKKAYDPCGEIDSILKSTKDLVFVSFRLIIDAKSALPKRFPGWKSNSIVKNVNPRIVDIMDDETAEAENILRILLGPRTVDNEKFASWFHRSSLGSS